MDSDNEYIESRGLLGARGLFVGLSLLGVPMIAIVIVNILG